MPLRVATLTRRSTDEQHQPFSIEAQDAKLAAYIQAKTTGSPPPAASTPTT